MDSESVATKLLLGYFMTFNVYKSGVIDPYAVHLCVRVTFFWLKLGVKSPDFRDLLLRHWPIHAVFKVNRKVPFHAAPGMAIQI